MYDGMRLWDMYLCIIMMFSVCNGFSVWFWFQSSCTYHISMIFVVMLEGNGEKVNVGLLF